MLSHGILKLEASPGEDQPLKQKSIRKGEKGKGKKKNNKKPKDMGHFEILIFVHGRAKMS